MLEIKDLKLKLENKDILSNITLNFEKGKVYGIVGPNGVGKTSLIKCLTGIYKETSGQILYDGKEVYNNPDTKKKIAYVADESSFFSSFYIKDILKYYKIAYEKFDEEKFHKLNDIFKVPLKKRFTNLSKGMKMRVALMLAFSQQAEYLILDEPTSGLDVMLKKTLLKLIVKEVAERKVTVLISSHNLLELERICNDVVILSNGKVTYENTLEDMKNKIKKLQIAFDAPIYEEDLNIRGIYKMQRVGRVFTIITDNYSEELIKEINKYNPLFIEEIELSLEDIFVYMVGGSELDEEVI